MRTEKSRHTRKGSGAKKRLPEKGKTRTARKIHKTQHRKTGQFHAHLAAISEATIDFVGYADAKTKQILYINKAGRKMVGIGERDDVTRLKISDVHPEWTNKMLASKVLPAAKRKGVWCGECAFLHKDGWEIPVLMTLMAHKNKKGEIETFSTISRDISDRKRMEEELLEFNESLRELVKERTLKLTNVNRELRKEIKARRKTEKTLKVSEEKYRLLIDNIPDIVWIADEKCNIVFISPVVEKIFGYAPEEIYKEGGDFWHNNTHPDDIERMKAAYESFCRGEGKFEMEYRFRRKDGKYIWIYDRCIMLNLKIGGKNYAYGVCSDITGQKYLRDELSRLSAAVDGSVNVIFITDVKGQIEHVNAAFERTTGYSRAELIGQNPRFLKSGEASATLYEELWNTILSGKTWKGTLKNKKKDGQYYYCESIISPICNEKGQITHFLCVQEDITEKVELKEDLNLFTSYASFDGLTGLYNRTRFIELVEDWILQAGVHQYIGAILLIDIDRFRLINDTYGSKMGDDLLKRMAEFLKDILAEIDMQYFSVSKKEIMESLLCRMGGDEFAVFLPSRDAKESLETAEEIRRRMESFRFNDWTGHITISIGIVLYPAHGITLYDLFKKADAAVFHAKEVGRNRSRLYKAEDLVLEKMHSRMEWKGNIQNALKEDRIVPWFQPILDLENGAIRHYEALVRIIDKEGAIVLPGMFIDTAEAFGLIRDIDRIIIEKTLKYQTKLQQEGRTFSFSINLSAKDLDDRDFMEFLKHKVTEVPAHEDRPIFELTETAAVHDLGRAVKFIRDLKTIGCKFSLDDFGVGFTSFRYLKEMEVDYIKIDGSFIRMLTESKNDRLFVKSMVDVAQGMGVKTVAEFVENKPTIQIIRELGVDYAQGYFIGKPDPEVM